MNADLNNTKLDSSDICIVPIPEVSVLAVWNQKFLWLIKFQLMQFECTIPPCRLNKCSIWWIATGVFTANPYGNASSGCMGLHLV